MGFIELILGVYVACVFLGVWLWKRTRRHRSQPPVYRVDIIEPDKHYPLIERSNHHGNF